MKEIIELLRDAGEVGHQIGYTEVNGEAEPDCEPDCTGCRAFEQHELLNDFPTVVCLCGSTRFMDAFFEAGWQETLKGNIVLSVGVCKHAEHHGAEALGPDVVRKLDDLHKRKIDLADEVLILNVGGYIGESTRSEINHAIKRGKAIRYLEPIQTNEPCTTS